MRNAFCGLMFLTACAAAQTVEGTIVDSVTGDGIAAVRVVLRPPVSEETHYVATTDSLGRFAFEGVKSGSYQFDYSSLGYRPSGPNPPRQVQVNGDGKPVQLEGRMTLLPRISGRVVDGDGKGIANAPEPASDL